MGKHIMRLNPKIRSQVNKHLLVLVLSLLWHLSAVIKPPKGYYKSKGRKPYEWRIVFCLYILRVVLVKKYDKYGAEMETDPRLLSFFKMDKLPSRSSIHRDTQLMGVVYLMYVMVELVKDFTKGAVDTLLDSTGISLMSRSIWYNLRLGMKVMKRDCYKLHAAISMHRGLIFNWRISIGKKNNCPFLISLLRPFKKLGLVIDDKGYSSRKNLQYIVDKLGAPFIKFKKNATARSKRYSTWKIQYYFYKSMWFIWKRMYSKRNRIENVFSVLKGVWVDRKKKGKKKIRFVSDKLAHYKTTQDV